MSQPDLNWDESKHQRDDAGQFASTSPPPRQTLMFDTNRTARLFEGALFEASKKKKPAKAAEGPSLLEQIEDNITQQAAENKPLGGQRQMFARRFEQAIDRYYRSSALRSAINTAAGQTDLSPSEEQREAGNYCKGKFPWNGLTIAIENPRGSIRRGNSKAGQSWQVEMKSHYGYILRNVSEADGDHVDVFVGPHPESDLVCVIDQRTPGNRFDEHKVMIGFTSARDARQAYLANYSDGWTGFESITPMTIGQFKLWLRHGDTGTRIAHQVARYKRDIDESKGHWVTMHGAHVFVSGNEVIKGPKTIAKKNPTDHRKLTIKHAVKGMGRLGYVFKTGAQTGPKDLAEYIFLKDGHQFTFDSDQIASMLGYSATPGIKKAPVPTASSPNPWTEPSPETKAAKNKPLPRGITFKEWTGEDEPDLSWKNIPIPDDIEFREWSDEVEPPEAAPPPKRQSRKAAIMEAAVSAAKDAEIPPDDVLPLMPEAHKFLKQQEADREKAKAWLRRVSGLTAGSLARMENKYLDHSTVKNWDTTSREFAANFPDVGFDPEGEDTPAEVWDFLREGKASHIPAYDPRVATLAALWASPKMRSSQRLPGDEEDDSRRHIDSGKKAEEAVPFSRARMIAEKFSRLFEKSRRMPLTSF